MENKSQAKPSASNADHTTEPEREVDVSLSEALHGMSPEERLLALQDAANFLLELRDAAQSQT